MPRSLSRTRNTWIKRLISKPTIPVFFANESGTINIASSGLKVEQTVVYVEADVKKYDEKMEELKKKINRDTQMINTLRNKTSIDFNKNK